MFDQIHHDHCLADFVDDDGEDDEGEVMPEDQVVLAYRPDGYPILPAFDSNTPLDRLKQIIRAYVRAVQSKFKVLVHICCLIPEILEFQKMNGRIPWAAIWTDNKAYFVKKEELAAYTLYEPSRMSQEDVLGFLTHWQKCQEAQKTWLLRFLKPDRQQFVEDLEIGVDSDVGLDDVGHGEGEKLDCMGGDGDKERRQSQTRRDAKGNSKPSHSGSGVDMHADGGMDLPLTLANTPAAISNGFVQ